MYTKNAPLVLVFLGVGGGRAGREEGQIGIQRDKLIQYSFLDSHHLLTNGNFSHVRSASL